MESGQVEFDLFLFWIQDLTSILTLGPIQNSGLPLWVAEIPLGGKERTSKQVCFFDRKDRLSAKKPAKGNEKKEANRV